MPIEIKMEGQVAVVTLNEGENRLNLDFLQKFMDALDHIEKADGCQCPGRARRSMKKSSATGLTLEWLMPIMQKNDTATAKKFIETMMALFRRICAVSDAHDCRDDRACLCRRRDYVLLL
ncbi:MAG: hypothetical protein MZV70_59925 [Desulfobacterales bacterium]|nr:hypothetical protein [Desulfobacterales bacterium]